LPAAGFQPTPPGLHPGAGYDRAENGGIVLAQYVGGTERGASDNESEYAAWLGEAGFHDVRRIRLPGPSGLMVGALGNFRTVAVVF
jgi:hypothetical protein